ncbi:hypothetical protein [Mycobacterium sp. 155]|uniref:hypothetical protein n=1 Tax=Mycobacterium sp. 155 TaxID=1157943 RepID=UPI000367B9CD|nr:hypothetical protein [Mycobacterium sp. 155]
MVTVQPTATATVTIRKAGRRHYIDGAPYSSRATLSNAGCKWDPDARGWWTGKADVAEKLVAHLTRNAPDPDAPETVSPDAAVLKGRANYKGKSYYVLAAGISARTGNRYAKLCSRDGALVFWVKDFEQFQVAVRYERPRSIDGLRRFAEEAKRGGARRVSYNGFRGWECAGCGEEHEESVATCWECGGSRD